ncbi:hypothetical protein [Spirillospora sp. NPDC029432]|uniref:hypothetical protein n=1 Tax=Spirillospora sp. NPDC029432 TaxID=3154599 RepID=UPI0034533F34
MTTARGRETHRRRKKSAARSGRAAGLVLGSLATLAYALARGWPPVVPAWALAAAAAATLLLGGLAGLYPAVRAARLPPTDALR